MSSAASNNFMKNSGSGNINKKMFGGIFLIIVVIILVYFIYTQYKGFSSYNETSPYFVEGIYDATVAKKIPAYRIKQPSDSQYGSEFTYSFWLYINDNNFSTLGGTSGTCGSDGSLPIMKHIFHKGSYDYYSGTVDGKTEYHYPLLQSPGVWLYPNTNKLNIQFNTYDNVIETVDIGNIPLNMWVNITVILIGNSVDVYVNCNLKKRQKLNGVPKLNYGDLYISNWNGFLGYLSRFRYFNYAIQPYMIDQICSLGPATTVDEGTAIGQPTANLSPNYWMSTGYPNSEGVPGYIQSGQTTA